MAIENVKDLTDAEDAATPQVIEPVEPPSSRFLYVDISAMRAKQLRRGALPRLGGPAAENLHPVKAERIAMEEVRKGLVSYDLPAFKPRAFTD
jgi:DNA-directed RNA polymerase subunit K/omega